ncbi:uncharacterized protein LOC131030356 [Cryptomeria japonica]|uniref:uncharacterized protein LOC131030356 n=1 Tax=Cryptomeria japonica TaxID=3369 RepID=UPI0027D9D6B2|nr:uncharacterized protein LOC131030356 [Cryptomeria japonica]
MAEVLSWLIKISRSRNLKGVEIHEGLELVSHSQFADDTIFFGEASIREAQVIRKTLDMYAETSSQSINMDKSEIFFFNISKGLQRRIASVLGFKVGTSPTKYLGVPLFEGIGRSRYWDELVDKYHNKAGSKEPKKISLVNWETVYFDKAEGGLGIRSLALRNSILGAKDIIIDHISWKVGHERKEAFWRDSWNCGVVLEEIIEKKEAILLLEDSIGKAMVNYF